MLEFRSPCGLLGLRAGVSKLVDIRAEFRLHMHASGAFSYLIRGRERYICIYIYNIHNTYKHTYINITSTYNYVYIYIYNVFVQALLHM